MLPLRVLHARIPGYCRPYIGLARFAEHGLSLPRELQHQLAIRVSERNGCSFCTDLHRAVALESGPPAPLPAVGGAATEAALRYADEVAATHDASEETFRSLREHFSEREVVEIVWLVAFTCFHNLMAKPLGLVSDGFCELRSRQLGSRIQT